MRDAAVREATASASNVPATKTTGGGSGRIAIGQSRPHVRTHARTQVRALWVGWTPRGHLRGEAVWTSASLHPCNIVSKDAIGVVAEGSTQPPVHGGRLEVYSGLY